MITNHKDFNGDGWGMAFFSSISIGLICLLVGLGTGLWPLIIFGMVSIGGGGTLLGAAHTSALSKADEFQRKVLSTYNDFPKELQKDYGKLNVDAVLAMRSDQATNFHRDLETAFARYREVKREEMRPAIEQEKQKVAAVTAHQETILGVYKELL